MSAIAIELPLLLESTHNLIKNIVLVLKKMYLFL